MAHRLRLLLAASILSMLLAGCKDDDSASIGSRHIMIKTIWPAEQPASYTVRIGNQQVDLVQAEAEFSLLLPTGRQSVYIYNMTKGIFFDGDIAVAGDYAGAIADFGMLYSYKGEVDVVDGRDCVISAPMQLQTRQLNLEIVFDAAAMSSIEKITAEMNGAAEAIHIYDGTLSGDSPVRFDLMRGENCYTASRNLFGMTSESPVMTVTITSSAGTYEHKVDMSEPMAGFNSIKDKALDISLTVEGIELETAVITVADWQEADIRAPEKPFDPTLDGNQVEIRWEGHRIDAVEFYDDQGIMVSSTVVDGHTDALYRMPDRIAKMMIYDQDRYYDVTLHIVRYDAATRTLEMDDDYYISEARHWALITDMNADYHLLADIDCTGYELKQLGSYPSNPFKGTFDGAGHKISNLKLASAVSNKGLFAYNCGTIRNLEIVSGNIESTSDVAAVGVICARNGNGGLIENCTNAASITDYQQVGGIAGINEAGATISQCRNNARVRANQSYAGGIAGENKGTITGSTNSGAVEAGYSFAAGIAGNNTGNITESENTAEAVISSLNAAGGIAASSTARITTCINRGAVTATGGIAGGIAGQASSFNSSIIDCVNEGEIESSGNTAGGIAGSALASTISNCSNRASGKVRALGNSAGGIVATASNNASITACANFADVSSVGMYAGGIAASIGGTILGCKNSGNINTEEYSAFAGGIAASYNGSIKACVNTGNVTCFCNTAGIAGSYEFNRNNDIKASYSTGTIAGDVEDRIAAIVGFAMNNVPKVTACYFANCDYAVATCITWDPTLHTAYRFSASPADPDTEGWPVEDAAKGWGIAQDGEMSDGCYWSTLGNASSETYPALWWEADGKKEPIVTPRD